MVNKTYVCSCGKDISYGDIYGTGVYSSNSNICTAALHAGVLKKGVPGQVEFEPTASPPVFRGTTQNGIKSLVIPHPYNNPFGPGAYRIKPAQKDTSEAH
jgi:hypothetical protein